MKIISLSLLKLQVTVISILAFLLTSCATPLATNTATAEWDELNQRISTLEASLGSQYETICAERYENLTAQLQQSEDVIKTARAETEQVQQDLKACRAKAAVRVKENLPQKKLLFGEVESVYFINEKRRMTARIDTGAETSSLGVYQMREFERDGKDWVRFKLSRKESAPTYEYRVSGRKSIKQREQDPADIRVEIKMDMRVGDKRFANQVFNLSDRSHLDQQVMLGRSFLQDIAVVDTALRFNLRQD
jgi:hypothetical protein